MMNVKKLHKINKFLKFFIFFSFVLFFLIFPLKEVEGIVISAIESIAESVIYNVSRWIIEIFSLVFRIIISFVQMIFGMTLDLTLKPDLVNIKQAANIPWEILRDFANLIIVFSFLIIAFGFILDIENFDAVKSFFYFIVIALIVNYSMLFTGALYDFSNFLISIVYNGLNVVSLSNVFDNFAKVSVTDFSQFSTLYDSFLVEIFESYKNIYNAEIQTDQDTLEFIAAFRALREANRKSKELREKDTVLSLITNATMNLIMLFIFSSSLIAIYLALTIIFVLRIGYFIFLIAFSPLAFSFLILPWTRGYWKTWLSNLINWTVFPFLVLFFVYLALLVGYNLGCLGNSNTCTTPSASPTLITSPFVAFQNIFLIILIFLAISFAKSLSSRTVDLGVNLGKRVSGFLGKTAPAFLSSWTAAKLVGEKLKKTRDKVRARWGEGSVPYRAFNTLTRPIITEHERQTRNKIEALEGSYELYSKDPRNKNNYARLIGHLKRFPKESRPIQQKMLEILGKDEGLKKQIIKDSPDVLSSIVKAEQAIRGEAPLEIAKVASIFLNKNIDDNNFNQNKDTIYNELYRYFSKNPNDIPLTSEDLERIERYIKEIGNITDTTNISTIKDELIPEVLANIGLTNKANIENIVEPKIIENILKKIKELSHKLSPDDVSKFISGISSNPFGRVAYLNGWIEFDKNEKKYKIKI